MEHLARGHQCALRRRVFNDPGLAAIKAAREQVLLRPLPVDVVALRAEVLVITAAKTDQDFIAP